MKVPPDMTTIRSTLEELILGQRLTDREILAEVRRRHPHCQTTLMSVRGTRTKLRQAGHQVKPVYKSTYEPEVVEAVAATVEMVREAGVTATEAARKDELPRRDDSTTNPGYHRLRVLYAQEDLRDFAEIIDTLGEHSRVNRSIMAGLVHEERAKLIRSDTSYQEAAWRLLADDLLKEEPVDHRESVVFVG